MYKKYPIIKWNYISSTEVGTINTYVVVTCKCYTQLL